MFQIELLSGGVFWVYAVYPQMSAFLIWKDDHWIWMAADKCKPYVLPWMGGAYPGGVTQDETTLERRFFSGEECKDFEQRRWPDGNDSSD